MKCSPHALFPQVARYQSYINLKKILKKIMANNSELKLPSQSEKDVLTSAFMRDMESFTVFDNNSNTFRPVVCCVCDSTPTKPNWSCFVRINIAADLFLKSNMMSSLLEGIYPKKLLQQYNINIYGLRNFVLSPASYINEFDEILMCKQCHSDLEENGKRYVEKKDKSYLPPVQSIANGHLIGDAPFELTCLNQVELSLVSRTSIYCQSWIFFAGCHQHIKGWHTFFKNRPTDNVGNLMQLTEAGVKNIILVVLCGPFTTTQRALTLKSTAVNPQKVIQAFRWLKENNYHYANIEIPDLNTITMPIIIDQNM